MNDKSSIKLIDPCPRCGENEAGDEDECPYDRELAEPGDEITTCRCCDKCREQCTDDI